MLNIFKKKKSSNPKEELEKEKSSQKSEADLDNIEFYAMPAKFRGGSGDGASHYKKIGLIILIAGAIVVAGGGIFLIRYIFIAPKADIKVSERPPLREENEEAAAEEDPEPPAAEETEEDEDEKEKDCGIIIALPSGDIDDTDEKSVCLGERIADGCRKTSVIVNASGWGNLELNVLGVKNNKCIINTTYPPAGRINSEEMKIYGGKYLQCAYDISTLNYLGYNSGTLANYIYSQNTVENLTEETDCVGSAVDAWKESLEEEEIPELKAGVDADNDGLTDVEENNIYVSDINSSDSDGDGYGDGTEVLNLYNPAGSNTLKESGLAGEFANSKHGYKVLYPKSWRIEDSAGGDLVYFYSGIDGLVQIIVQDNTSRAGIKSWYADLVGSLEDSVRQSVETTKNGLEAIYSVDGLTAYLAPAGGGSKVYVLSYSPEESGTIEFLTTLKMMINSFRP